jgi:RNA polymerase sigma-70 factor (ECF subfamily)
VAPPPAAATLTSSTRALRLRSVTPEPSATVLDIDLERELERHRRELTGYCYRMLGSGSEAEDAVQETLVRAWKAFDRFEGRSSLRSWLYRIATNVCVDMLRGPQRRARPMDLGPSSTTATAVLRPVPENTFVLPVADGRVLATDSADPAELAEGRESIRLAFVAALQHLPARQRAVLILCEVLKWQATEVAELLDTSVASVNSALQRARATLGSLSVDELDTIVDPEHEALLARYVDAFERYDMAALAELLREDVVISMPPHDLWLEGPAEVVAWMTGPGCGCDGSRLVPVQANGTAAFGSYRPAGEGRWEPFAIQVIEVKDGRISGHHNFLYPELFPEFGLPSHLEG